MYIYINIHQKIGARFMTFPIVATFINVPIAYIFKNLDQGSRAIFVLKN